MPEAQPKKPVGLRTFADDYQRLRGNDDAPLPLPTPAPATSSTKESLQAMADAAPDSAASTPPASLTIDVAPATQADVREVVAAYDTSDDSITEHFDDLDVTLHNEDSEDTTATRVAEDVAAHTVDVDSLLTDANSAAVGVKSQDVRFRDDNGESGNANIIRETKDAQFRLIPAIIASIQGWFVAKKETKIAKEAAKPTIINPESRKERLIEAARHSALPKGAQVLVAKDAAAVSKDKQAAESEGLSIMEKSAIPTPSWSHVVDEAADTTSTHEDAPPAPPAHTADTSSATTLVPPVKAEARFESNTPAGTDATEKAPPSKTVDATTATADTTPPAIAATRETADKSPSSLPSTPATATPDMHTTAGVSPTPKASALTPLSDNTLISNQTETASSLPAAAVPTSEQTRFSLMLIGAIVVAIVLGGLVAYGVYIVTEGRGQGAVTAVSSATIYDEQIGISAVNPFNFLQEAAQTVGNTADTTLHLYPTITTNEGDVSVLTPEALLRPLNTNITDPFLRAIESITFGATRTQVPFVVITVNDFDIAFAGMLRWEQSLADDLSPFLGEATTEPFTDIRFANQDLRLSDRLDDELVYTFMSKRIIIITTDRAALQDINTLLR